MAERYKTNTWEGGRTRVVPLERHPGKQARVRKAKKAAKRNAVKAKYAGYLRGIRKASPKRGNTSI
jgi:hypothetical protein